MAVCMVGFSGRRQGRERLFGVGSGGKRREGTEVCVCKKRGRWAGRQAVCRGRGGVRRGERVSTDRSATLRTIYRSIYMPRVVCRHEGTRAPHTLPFTLIMCAVHAKVLMEDVAILYMMLPRPPLSPADAPRRADLRSTACLCHPDMLVVGFYAQTALERCFCAMPPLSGYWEYAAMLRRARRGGRQIYADTPPCQAEPGRCVGR